MSQRVSSRKRQPRGLRAIGLFAAVWLNLALAPCAMAVEDEEDHNCPHCPPAQAHGHHETHPGMQAQTSCADDLADCGLDESFSHDTRSGQSPSKDAPEELPAVAVAGRFDGGEPVIVRQRAPPAHLAGRLPAGPPIHLLNCVFLD